jgi:putative DNA primase/helicase
MNPLDELNNQFTAIGLMPKNTILDGTVKRCPTTDKPKSKTGWYIGWTKYVNGKDVVCCSAGDWTKGNDALMTYKSWEGDDSPRFSPSDLEAIRKTQLEQQRKVDAEKAKQHKKAAEKAQLDWITLSETGNSLYLDSKGVKAHGVRFGSDEKEGAYIAIPVCNEGGIKGLQLIYDTPLSYAPDRNKTFTAGTDKKGGFSLIGTLSPLIPVCFTEGYATAASIYEATNYPVVMCFDAGNIKPVVSAWRKKYPQQNFIICADNDQWKAQNVGVDKATDTAKAQDCFLAIPDFTGLDTESKPTDFNDLHKLAGLDHVRTALANVSKPTVIEAVQSQETDGEKQPDVDGHTNNDYPSYAERPCYLVHEQPFKGNGRQYKAGTYLHSSTTNKDTGDITLVDAWICSPLFIEAVTLDQHNNNYGRFLRFKPTRGGYKKWCMPMSLLGSNGDALRSELLNKGVLIDFDAQRLLPRYLTNFIPTKTLEVATQTGWHKGAYILPESCIGSDDYFYQSENIHADVPYRQAGSLTEWQNNIARYCVGNPLLMLSVCCAFAGALLKPAHQQGGGFHLVGESSKGKSTGLELACSVHGDGTYKRTWKATGNGMEATAAMFNDGFLALDEIGECDPRDVGNIVYQLANGAGKSRANRSGGAKASYQWRVMVLSNGEVSIESAMQEGGKRAKAGQLMRLLNIPIFGKYGAFDCLHDMKDGRALADHLKTASLNYYGVAGIEYLTKLVTETRNINELAERYTLALIGGETLSSQESRAAKRFALIALSGELATEYGITGWTKGDACQGVKACFAQWRLHFGGGDTEDRQIKESIQAYVEIYGDARFTSTHDDRLLHGIRSGYWKDGVHGREWMFSKSGLMEATKGYDLKKVVDVLKGCGWLILDGQGKSTRVVDFKNNMTGEKRFYFIHFNSISDIEKTGVSGVSGVSAYNGAASTLTPTENKSVSGVSEYKETPIDTNTANTYEKTGVSVTSHEWRGTNTTNTEKNNNQHEHAEKINSRINAMEI